MGVKVSVIIPVYNAENFLGECIESLLAQTLKECEFIFVNDGSKDRSEQIIHQYKEKDKRIILINQENQGVSCARNKGLETAVGEYIGFVDADDFVKAGMFEMLYNIAKQGDLDTVVSDFESEVGNKYSRHSYSFPKNTKLNKDYINEVILPYLLEEEDLNTACNKLYKRKILLDETIRFPENMAIGEDGLFNLKFFNKANTLIYADYSGYFYRNVLGSATRNHKHTNLFQKAIEIYKRQELTTFIDIFGKEKVQQCKSKKLIKSIMAYLYQFAALPDTSFHLRYKYIKSMINHELVRESLLHYSPKGRYERVVIKMMKSRLTLGLILTALYIHKRNEKLGG